MKDWNNFFGSKLNSVLLIILIILMVFAIRIILKDKEKYIAPLLPIQNEPVKIIPEMDRTKLLGNKDDLVSFSIWPDAKVRGIVSYHGVIKGGYFFEANIQINVLDLNKKALKRSNAMATTEWTTAGPVDFEGNIDFSGLPKGPAYFEIHNDNPSDMRQYDKSVLIPIVIE